MVSWHGAILRSIERFWNNLRRFAFYNRTMFELFFIFLYAIEQAVLVRYAFKTSSLTNLSCAVSIFAIIVLVTFALHKLVMESRIKVLEDEVKDIQLDKFYLEEKYKEANKNYNELFNRIISENLNTQKHSLKNNKKVIK